MKYLFIDTAHSFIVSIIDNNKIVYYKNDISNSDTSGKIMSFLDEALTKTNLSLKDIDKIFIVTGPGSFTGIRVGVTIAKTIGYCLNIPLIKLSELELMATSNSSNYIAPIIDARRGYVYGAIYDKDLNVYLKESHILLKDLEEKFPNDCIFIDNSNNIDLLRIIKKHELDEPINPHELKPNYLKKTEAEENLSDKRNN